MTEQNTAWLLAQWALWQREGGGLRLSVKSPMVMFAAPPDEVRICSEISDDDAMRVDAVMAKLRQVNPLWRKVLVLAFVNNLNAAQIGSRLGISRYLSVKLYESAYGKADELLSADGGL